MVPNHVSSIWDPPAGNVTLACMVVVDDLHGVSESFRKRGRRWRGIPRAGYRCSYELRRSTWNTPRNLNVSNLQLPQRICRSNLEQPAGNRNRAGKVSLRSRSPDFSAIETTPHVRATRAPRSMWNMDTAKSNPELAAAAFAQDSSFCTQLCVAFELEWHYSAPISGFSKN
jgi:hypothetical protein